MIKTTEELKEQAQKIGLEKWTINICSICGYPCGYIIKGDEIAYDNGCDCGFGYHTSEKTWRDITENFNQNQPENNPDFKDKNPKEYAEHYKVWQFE